MLQQVRRLAHAPLKHPPGSDHRAAGWAGATLGRASVRLLHVLRAGLFRHGDRQRRDPGAEYRAGCRRRVRPRCLVRTNFEVENAAPLWFGKTGSGQTEGNPRQAQGGQKGWGGCLTTGALRTRRLAATTPALR